MTPTLALALMVLSAALHAVWNVALRRQRDAPAASLLFVAGGCAIVLAGASAQALHGDLSARELRSGFLWALAAGASEGLYVLSLSRALQIGPVAAVYSVSRGLPLLLLWPLSHALLGERAGPREAVAVAVLIAGVAVLAPGRDDVSRTTTRAGYLWATATAVFNVTNSLVYKEALLRGVPLLVLPAVAFLVATPIAAAPLLARDGARALYTRLCTAAAGGWTVPLGATCFAASFLVALVVLRVEGAAWVLTLRNLSIAFVPLLGWAALGERPSGRTVVGVGLVLAGAVALGGG